ncbi:MAG: TM2 domain-containing protein [Flavisolibacter sp.]
MAFVAILTLSLSVEAAIVKPIDPTPSNAAFEQLKKMRPKDFEKMTGQHLSLFQKVKFKAAKFLAAPSQGGKSQLTAVLLAFFLGGLGIHRFYLGYTWQGIVQLLTLGGLGVWALIDFIRILTGSLQPKNGDYDKTL